MSNTHTSARAVGWFDHPVMSLLLGASWLALSHSLALVHLLSAALIALIVPRLIGSFMPQASRLHWPSAIRLTLVVLWDIVVSNIAVARLVLGSMDKPTPLWIPVPLASSNVRVNALFASIITTTPGTVSCVVDEEQHVIWVHALNGDDAQTMAQDMKQRYEAPLLKALNVHTQASVGGAA
ncbi:Na+/H+ antiporter subunit E [Comamonadaceae bacterium M7527]|nr:Na+/H+ antiporter subunit E [Comamonadaceae bacterium M7527]